MEIENPYVFLEGFPFLHYSWELDHPLVLQSRKGKLQCRQRKGARLQSSPPCWEGENSLSDPDQQLWRWMWFLHSGTQGCVGPCRSCGLPNVEQPGHESLCWGSDGAEGLPPAVPSILNDLCPQGNIYHISPTYLGWVIKGNFSNYILN